MNSWAPLKLWGVVALATLGGLQAQGQILYVTKQAPHTPVPLTPMFPFSVGQAAPVQAVPAPSVPAPAPASVAVIPPSPPSLDKAELEQHVIAFQKKRAEEGSSSAQYELGMRYWIGNGVTKNAALGRKWLKLAADAGETQAKDKLRELDRAKQSASQTTVGSILPKNPSSPPR